MTDTFTEELEVEILNDAEVVGVVAKEVWDRRISVLYSPKGARLSRDKWTPRSATFGEFFASVFSKHTVGPKDGPCVVLGDGSERSKRSMRFASMVGIDVDNGQSPQEIEDRLLDLNICALIYSTHSHMKSHTDVAQDKLIKELDLDDGETPTRGMMVGYLTGMKGLDPALFEGLSDEPVFTHEDMPVWRLSHRPMPKFRVFFPLKEDFQFSHPTEAHKDRLERFADKLRGLAEMVGIDQMDQSCTDPSRLFYLPTHGKDRPHFITLLSGEMLDFDSVAEVKSVRKGLSALKEIGRSLSGSGSLATPGGMSLKKWAATYAAGFEILDLIKDHAPDKLRSACSSNQGMHAQCPFDDEHSNPGDPEDQGFFVINGSESEGGFVAHCMHDSCQGRDRLDYLHQMIVEEWFDEALITDEDYTAIVADSDEEYEEKAEEAVKLGARGDIKKAIKALNEGEVDRADTIIEAIAKAKFTTLERAEMLKDMSKSLKLSKTAMEKHYKETKERMMLTESDAIQEEYEKKAEMGVIFVDKTSFDTQVRLAWSKLGKKQKDNPYLFWSDQGRIVRMRDNMGMKTVREINSNDLMDAVAHSCHWKTFTMEGDQTAPPPDAVIRTMMASDNARNRLPLLKGIVTAPFFTEDGTLVMEGGYNESGYYLADVDAGKYPEVPMDPTQEEVDHALSFIMDNLFVDFPFEDNTDGVSSKCHALAMLLQPFIRPMISGPTPIYFVDKPLPGTGATLLIDSVLRISSGRPGEAQTIPANEEEFRKTITASLSEGASYFWLDNVDRTIDSESFASVTSSEFFQARRLGSSSTIRFPIRNQFIVCGNNVDMRSEMIRRMLLVHLDPKTADPTARSGFKHKHLLRWVKENRPALVHACLVLCQAWIADGCPEKDTMKASYEHYSACMGGIMDSIGVEGFMENESVLRQSSDGESGPMDEFIYLWWDMYEDEYVGIGGGEGSEAEGLFAVLSEQQLPFVYSNSESSLKSKLARKLKMLQNRQFKFDTDDETVEVRVEVTKRNGRVNEYRLSAVERVPKQA